MGVCVFVRPWYSSLGVYCSFAFFLLFVSLYD